MLDPSQLDRATSNGTNIAQGVEMDDRGRPVAYHILPETPGGDWAGFAPPIRVPARDVLHIFKPSAAGQVRGASMLASAILAANEFDQALDATLTQTKTQALLSAWLVNQNDMSGDAPFDVTELSLEPGVLRQLPAGWDIRFLSPEGTKDFPATARLYLQQLAAAMGVPEWLLSGDMSAVNYSSARAALIPFRQRIEAMQYGILVPQFLDRVWAEWLAVETLAGRIDADPATRAEWIVPKLPQVDPAKELTATRTALELGLTSRSKAVAELGWSVDQLDAEIAADRAREAALGLTYSKGAPDAV